MAEEATNIQAIKTASDGKVNITIEKYNELLEKISEKDSSIRTLKDQLTTARNQRPVITTTVEKTAEMAAQDHRMWGLTFMGGGVAMFIIGAVRYAAGRNIE